jgi:hypothetical protein
VNPSWGLAAAAFYHPRGKAEHYFARVKSNQMAITSTGCPEHLNIGFAPHHRRTDALIPVIDTGAAFRRAGRETSAKMQQTLDL